MAGIQRHFALLADALYSDILAFTVPSSRQNRKCAREDGRATTTYVPLCATGPCGQLPWSWNGGQP